MARQFFSFTETMVKTLKHLRREIVTTAEGDPYLERLILEEHPDGSKKCIHIIYRSDDDRDPHDHPWDFKSTIIYGSYLEFQYEKCDRCGGCGEEEGSSFALPCGRCRYEPLRGYRQSTHVYTQGMTNEKTATDLHRLQLIDDQPVITYVEFGPKIREWGFQTEDGWVEHNTYLEQKFGVGEMKVEHQVE